MEDILVTCFVYIPLGCILLLSILLVERYVQYKKLCKKYEHLPGVTQFLPPHIAQFLPKWMLPDGIIDNPFEIFTPDTILRIIKENNSDYFKIIFGIANLSFVIGDCPELAKEFATKGAKVFRKTEFMDRSSKELFFGTNVFAEPDHHTWLKHRQLIDQSFSPSNLKLVADVTNEVVEKDMIPAINSQLERRDVMVDMARLTMDVIGKAAFGYSLNSFHSKPGEVTLEQQGNIFMSYLDYLRVIPTKFLRSNLKIGAVGKLHFAVKSFTDVISKIIEKRERSDDKDEAADILSLLLKERKNNRDQSSGGILTDEELVSNSFVLLVAGHDTTSRTLGYATYLLSKNPHIQQELHDAVDKVVKETGRDTFDFSDYESGRLDYVKAVFNEVLRLIPVAFGSFRDLTKNVEYNGTVFPKGAIFGISFVHTLVNEKYWDEPLSFKPMRFIKDGKFIVPNSNPFVFTPFGVGGRICAVSY